MLKVRTVGMRLKDKSSKTPRSLL